MVGLGDLPGGIVSSGARSISSDGTTIVGSSGSELSQTGSEAFRWTAETGIQGLGFLNPADLLSTAQLTSSDGRLVFGLSTSLTSNHFFVWDQVNGMRDIVDVFEDELNIGSEIAGWSELQTTGISDNGLSLVGAGINPSGNREAWLIQLAHPIGIPEPSTLTLIAFGLVILLNIKSRMPFIV